MAEQGSYPLNGRALQASDTLTGVVSGQTADIPLNVLAAFTQTASGGSGPTVNRPTSPGFLGQGYFDTTLGFMVWCSQLSPVLWVNAAGIVS